MLARAVALTLRAQIICLQRFCAFRISVLFRTFQFDITSDGKNT